MFVIDAYARRVLGWSVATTMTSQLVVDAVDQAAWTRRRDGQDLTGSVANHDHGVQYLAVAYAEHLDVAHIKPSTGAVGSSFDNAPVRRFRHLYRQLLNALQRSGPTWDSMGVTISLWSPSVDPAMMLGIS